MSFLLSMLHGEMLIESVGTVRGKNRLPVFLDYPDLHSRLLLAIRS